MNNLLSVFLLSPPQGGAGSGASSLMMIVLMIVIFYFFMIRPQMKKAKEAKQMRESLKKGDKIITIGGVHGKITEVAETTFVIETEGGGRLRIEKTAISSGVSDQLQAAK